MRRNSELPPSKVVVKNGKVVRIEEWCLWNMAPTNTVLITRDDHGEITCMVTDPEHGSGPAIKGLTPEEAIGKRFHPNVAARYLNALHMVDPTATCLAKLFPGYLLDFSP